MTSPAVDGALAFALALVLTPLAMAVARATGVVDRPGPLKVQEAPVPYLGGVAVFVALVPAVAAHRPLLLAPLGGALGLGLADDLLGLSPLLRLAGQVALGLGVAACLATRLGEPGGAIAVAAVTVLLVNGVNLVDGLDGLAGGVVAITAVAWAVLLGGTARAISVSLAAALVGFLAYNRPPARVYLGDAGAYLLGACCTVLLTLAWAPGRPAATSAGALLLVAVPVAEVAFALVRRLRARDSVVAGDRRHPYDLLVARGWPVARSTLAYVAVAAVLAGAGLIVARLHSVPGAVVAAMAGGLGLVVLAAGCGSLRPERGAS